MYSSGLEANIKRNFKRLNSAETDDWDMDKWSEERLNEFSEWVKMKAYEQAGPLPSEDELEEMEKELEEN